jgi:hypothetical protein
MDGDSLMSTNGVASALNLLFLAGLDDDVEGRGGATAVVDVPQTPKNCRTEFDRGTGVFDHRGLEESK